MKRYDVSIFFDGPRCGFSGKLHETEIIETAQAPWLWLARAIARGGVGNMGRCGYAITLDGKTIEERRALVEFSAPV